MVVKVTTIFVPLPVTVEDCSLIAFGGHLESVKEVVGNSTAIFYTVSKTNRFRKDGGSFPWREQKKCIYVGDALPKEIKPLLGMIKALSPRAVYVQESNMSTFPYEQTNVESSVFTSSIRTFYCSGSEFDPNANVFNLNTELRKIETTSIVDVFHKKSKYKIDPETPRWCAYNVATPNWYKETTLPITWYCRQLVVKSTTFLLATRMVNSAVSMFHNLLPELTHAMLYAVQKNPDITWEKAREEEAKCYKEIQLRAKKDKTLCKVVKSINWSAPFKFLYFPINKDDYEEPEKAFDLSDSHPLDSGDALDSGDNENGTTLDGSENGTTLDGSSFDETTLDQTGPNDPQTIKQNTTEQNF